MTASAFPSPVAAPTLTVTANATITVPHSPEDVWAFLADVQNSNGFLVGCSKNIIQGGGDLRLGAKVDLYIGRKIQTALITTFEPHRCISLQIVEGLFEYMLTDMIVDAVDGGSRMTFSTIAGQEGPAFRSLTWLVKAGMKKILERELRRAAQIMAEASNTA